MPAFVPALLEHGPGHLLHSFHETCGRRLGRGPRGMPRVHACQGAPFGGQAAADPALQQGQHTPSDSAPPDQAGAMLLPRPLQRGQRQHALPPAAAPLAERPRGARPHRLPQREAVSTVVHCLASPTQLLEGGGYGCLGDDRCPPAIPLDPPGGGPRPGRRTALAPQGS